MNATYKEIPLSEISSNPHNPRKAFLGAKFDELVASIQEKGVIEPIIIRLKSKGKAKYEVVAGDRRFKAACLLAEENKGLEHYKIPVVIRELTDDEAFDFMIIENLQREDLTGFEEAWSFKEYGNKKGRGSTIELAKRIGISPSYIRRKISALSLPKYILTAWEKEDLQFSHLEQLRRLKNAEELKEAFEFAAGRHWGGRPASKRELKEHIDNLAPSLKDALFDLVKEGCDICPQNSSIQQKVWEIGGMKSPHCLDAVCFKQKQNNFLLSNWKGSKIQKKYSTMGFRFQENVEWNEYESFTTWSLRPIKKCKSCADFLTIITPVGKVVTAQACFNPRCYHDREKAKDQKVKEKVVDPDAPRVSWHGEYFREIFFKGRIPEVHEGIEPEFAKARHLILISMLKSNSDLKKWFLKRMKIKTPEYASYYWFPDDKLFPVVFGLNEPATLELIKEASLQVILQEDFGAGGRRLIADYLGISVKKEFAITREYLEKKSIREMREFGEKSRIFKAKKVQDYLTKTLKKKPGKFSSCKKAELVDLFLNSGIDLVGKVPDEIL